MSDIVERLKWRGSATDMPNAPTPTLCREAAAEIERLRAVLEAAREALKFYSCDCQPGQCENGPLESNIDTVSCGYRARAALERKPIP